MLWSVGVSHCCCLSAMVAGTESRIRHSSTHTPSSRVARHCRPITMPALHTTHPPLPGCLHHRPPQVAQQPLLHRCAFQQLARALWGSMGGGPYCTCTVAPRKEMLPCQSTACLQPADVAKALARPTRLCKPPDLTAMSMSRCLFRTQTWPRRWPAPCSTSTPTTPRQWCARVRLALAPSCYAGGSCALAACCSRVFVHDPFSVCTTCCYHLSAALPSMPCHLPLATDAGV